MTTSSPLVSVFTPTADRPQWLTRCIASTQRQTLTEFEHVVYDVGQEPVEHLIPDDPRYVYARGEKKGPAADFQAALELTTAPTVTPLADDDTIPPHALLAAIDVLGIEDADWLVGRTVLVNEQGDPMAFRGGTWEHVEETKHGLYMLGGAVYWRRELTDQLGGFDSAYDGAADFDLYKRFLAHSDPARTLDTLYVHVVHDAQDTRVNHDRQADATRRIMQR